MALPALSAQGRLFHPEFMQPHHGPALIDCPRGLGTALRSYFTEFARREGVSAVGAPEIALAAPKAAISHFDVHFPDGQRFRGFVYVDPTLTEAEDEPGEEEESEPSERVCSAVFAAEPLSADEAARLERGYFQTLTRLGLPDPEDRFRQPARRQEAKAADRERPSTKGGAP